MNFSASIHSRLSENANLNNIQISFTKSREEEEFLKDLQIELFLSRWKRSERKLNEQTLVSGYEEADVWNVGCRRGMVYEYSCMHL